MTFAERAVRFNKQLRYTGAQLPKGIRIMNPFKESDQALGISEIFYHKYFNDPLRRHIILGINPGRFGAGLTGIPFTDPKRLISECQIEYRGKTAHEPSSVFVYEMIKAYGGAYAFYKKFYINSICPLGFTYSTGNGREKNYNYYDSKELIHAVQDFITENISKLIDLGIETDTCFCFGTGKNEKFLTKLNQEHHFFKNIVALEHPRFIMQYKNADMDFYIEKYITAFRSMC